MNKQLFKWLKECRMLVQGLQHFCARIFGALNRGVEGDAGQFYYRYEEQEFITIMSGDLSSLTRITGVAGKKL